MQGSNSSNGANTSGSHSHATYNSYMNQTWLTVSNMTNMHTILAIYFSNFFCDFSLNFHQSLDLSLLPWLFWVFQTSGHTVSISMSLPPNSVGECIMYWGCPSAFIVCLSVRPSMKAVLPNAHMHVDELRWWGNKHVVQATMYAGCVTCCPLVSHSECFDRTDTDRRTNARP